MALSGYARSGRGCRSASGDGPEARIDGGEILAEPHDDVPYNPYQSQTTANTNPAWLDAGHKNIDADIDGMADFAGNMKIIMENLRGKVPELNLLGTMPINAWAPGSLPEGAYTAHLMLANYNELQQYLSFLAQGLMNTGSAAQTIANAYAGTDGWSAADINAVNFAYGDSRAKRPAGYPEEWLKQVKTWQDAYSENMSSGNGAASGVVVRWTDQGTFTDAQGQHKVAVSTDGVRREIITRVDPYTGNTVTTTIVTYPPNPKGQTDEERAGYTRTSRADTTTFATSGNTVQQQTTYYGNDGKLTGSQTQTTTYTDGEVSGTSTQNKDKDGNNTTGNSVVTNADGSQTITKTQEGKDPKVLQIGEQTDGVVGAGEQPAQDKINQLRPQ
ncbi:hypothetical protein ACFPIJ_58745 [Dactylosporangium cerinum]|uniref:Uncharacterized protein n=1 Tax=Dactylosporangium cerinum TaxID=1434730 RepID=A0ABV9WFV2_9ACTN